MHLLIIHLVSVLLALSLISPVTFSKASRFGIRVSLNSK